MQSNRARARRDQTGDYGADHAAARIDQVASRSTCWSGRLACMTSHNVTGPFVSAPNGWRIALDDPDNCDITVVPLIGWQPLAEHDAGSSIEGSPVEPVVLFDNIKEPVICTVADTIAGWSKGTYVHQVLAPGVDVREIPEGWTVIDPYQG